VAGALFGVPMPITMITTKKNQLFTEFVGI
jgi:hypothetical protein